MDLTGIEFGPKMQACSERERQFVMHYLLICAEDGRPNASEAARRAGYADAGKDSTSIRVRAHTLIHRERVKEAIAEVGKREFVGLLFPAIFAARRLIEKPDHPDHAGMVKATLASLGLGERTAIDLNVSGSVTVNHTDAAIEDLRRLKALGVPRDKLVEMYGFSGLDRYEKMLAAADARALPGPVIEGEAQEVG